MEDHLLLQTFLIALDDYVGKVARRMEIIKGLEGLSGLIKKSLGLDKTVRDIARGMKDESNLLLVGRGFQSATCLEGALKIKEVSYIHAEGILAGELKHGPLALIAPSMPVLMVMNKDRHYNDTESAFKQITARMGAPIVIRDEDDETPLFKDSVTLRVPKTVDALQGIINIVPVQLLSYHLAVMKGFDPDSPRNLAKSVTTG